MYEEAWLMGTIIEVIYLPTFVLSLFLCIMNLVLCHSLRRSRKKQINHTCFQRLFHGENKITNKQIRELKGEEDIGKHSLCASRFVYKVEGGNF